MSNVEIQPLEIDLATFDVAANNSEFSGDIFVTYVSNFVATAPLQNSQERLQEVGL